MRSGTRNTAKHWVRLAMKLGLLATDPKVWANVNEQFSSRIEDVGDALNDRYDKTLGRLKDARAALRGNTQWIAPAASFIGGFALGAGVGLLFAPTSGQETRTALRNAATGVRDKVSNIANTPPYPSSAAS
jgi:hypothetical protein